MHRVILAAGAAILVSLGVILARSQGRAQSSDAPAVSSVSSPSEDSAGNLITAAELAELHAAVATVMVDGSGRSGETVRRLQALMVSRMSEPDSETRAR
jgi:hypothetical protein